MSRVGFGKHKEDSRTGLKEIQWARAPLLLTKYYRQRDFASQSQINDPSGLEGLRDLAKLALKDEESQVNTLIYTMGGWGRHYLVSFGLSVKDKKKYETVKDKLEHCFIKWQKIYKRAKFNRQVQCRGESVDSFITFLYSLVEHCKYRALTNEIIR